MPTLESTITDAIMQKLRAIPRGYATKMHGSVYTRAGEPDIRFNWWSGEENEAPVSFAFEVKQPGKKPSEIQEVQMERLQKAGVSCHVVHSTKEVRSILQAWEVTGWSEK